MLRLEIARKTVAAEAGPRVVLEGLHVALDAGEVVALTGPSGCGKTTTLRIIAGLDRHYAGTMAWRDGAPARIGTVFQEPRLLPWRTVLENIAFVRPPDPDGVPALLETLGLAGVGGLYPRALSGGMARRVALARALAAEPELLLLDEPFVSLDPVSADACRAALLAFWRARACSILLVTHDLGEAAALADRIVLLPSARSVVIPPDQRRRGLDEGARLAARLI